MSEMIHIASGFQYSVNLRYDLNRENKIENFIPTSAALDFMEDIMKSTRENSTERARVLVGAYGKGKSHMVLTMLGLLLKKDLQKFKHLQPKLSEHKTLAKEIDRYYSSSGKILPVIISGSSTSIPQSFLTALEQSLRDNNLLDIMPDTNYKAAVQCIQKWQQEYPDTYQAYTNIIADEPEDFIKRLSQYDVQAYETFERLYPQLTAGSVFNPFLGFDIAELYSSVVRSLKAKGYQGIYVVYDEFSKYLEANIQEASVSDTKMLQDFAEKCNRSGKEQLHILLISHKEIANYIDRLPKQKTDGWRGVSERFKHIHMRAEYAQTYELIDNVIQKEELLWKAFTKKYHDQFTLLIGQYLNHPIFADLDHNVAARVILESYPLHPVSVFILPRLSERIAQNERTLFTFLSADGTATLRDFLRRYGQDDFHLITADLLFDYFRPLMEKEAYDGEIHQRYLLAKSILQKVHENELQQKIVKILALFYMVEQFDVLPPTREELTNILRFAYSAEAIDSALDDLIERQYVVYLKRSNGYLCLKQSSGVDVQQKIKDFIASHQDMDMKTLLNGMNFNRYLYPARYNDEREITRFFAVEFITAEEVREDVNWQVKSESIAADGVIYAVLPNEEAEIQQTADVLQKSSDETKRFVFVVPKHYQPIRDTLFGFYAAGQLRDAAGEDYVLRDEYNLIYEDYYVIVRSFLQSYTRPEMKQAYYYHMGQRLHIRRRAELSTLLSKICDFTYPMTPVINNEVINKNEITVMAARSRHKVVTAILRPITEPNLGLIGSGQDMSIMRSTLMRTGILTADNDKWQWHKHTGDAEMDYTMATISAFLEHAGENQPESFADLYHQLMSPTGRIGLRRGVIPILLAVAMRPYLQSLLIYEKDEQLPIQADTLEQINAHPENYQLRRLNWSQEKETYIEDLGQLFNASLQDHVQGRVDYDATARAIMAWYLALPKYTKELQQKPTGEKLEKKIRAFRKAVSSERSSSKLLFVKIPEACQLTINDAGLLIDTIKNIKTELDNALDALVNEICQFMIKVFRNAQPERASLHSILMDWYEQLPSAIGEEVFSDGTTSFLKICQGDLLGDVQLIRQLAREVTGLRLEDWSDKTYSEFCTKVKRYKQTADEFQPVNQKNAETAEEVEDGYYFSYPEAGQMVRRHFVKVPYSPRAKLLLNSITADIEAMGQAINPEEKRQVVAEILQKLF